MTSLGKPITQRQLRVGEMIKQALGMLFIRDEAKLPNLSTNAEEIVNKLKEFSFMIRKVLSKKIVMKFLPKLYFVKDDSFDYAEKIENLIKQTNKQG